MQSFLLGLHNPGHLEPGKDSGRLPSRAERKTLNAGNLHTSCHHFQDVVSLQQGVKNVSFFQLLYEDPPTPKK
eukprot:1946292-Amphidinium_carterae.1